MRKSVSLEDVVTALNELGGEAQSWQIKDRITQDFGGVPDNYKNATSFRETIQVIIQEHCPQEKKYTKKPVFQKMGYGRFRLSNAPGLQAEEQRLKDIEAKVSAQLDAIRFEDEHFEGQQRERYTSYYERDPRLRAKAIAIHGTKCSICKFDFQETYGDHGQGFIEVHHVIPVSELGGNTKVDPETDMVTICSNCHRMIHHKRNSVLSIEQLSQLVTVK